MSTRAACYTAVCIGMIAMSMLGFVAFRTELLKLSYAIDQTERKLEADRETYRALRYDVSRMKSLASLEHMSTRTDLDLHNPAQVNRLTLPGVTPPAVPVTALSFPQKFLQRFTFVPDALAKSEDDRSS